MLRKVESFLLNAEFTHECFSIQLDCVFPVKSYNRCDSSEYVNRMCSAVLQLSRCLVSASAMIDAGSKRKASCNAWTPPQLGDGSSGLRVEASKKLCRRWVKCSAKRCA